jgi:hypothetical protein
MMRTCRRHTPAAVTMALAFSSLAWATSLDLGSVETGSINSAAQSNTYTFSANANDVVNFTMVATSGNLSPTIILYDPNGAQVAAAYNGGCGGSRVEMNTVTLKISGTYTVLLRDCSSTNTGSYVIFGQRTNNPSGAVPFAFGGLPQTGTITSAAQSNAYTFSANANDVINVTMTVTSGNLSPTIVLYSPTGAQVSVAYNGGCGGSRVEMNTVTLSVAGTYTVLVRDCGDANTGTYTLYGQRTNNPTGAVPLSFGGQPEAGTISSPAQSNSYTFGGDANDVVSMTMVVTSGKLSPVIELYNPSGALVSIAYNGGCGGASAALNNIKLPLTGNYTVLVRDCSDTNTGNYVLSAQCIGVCPLPAPVITSLSPASAVAGNNGFTLTVKGANFVAGPSSTVYWNGSGRTTTYVSATQVQAAILASDIGTAGTFPVTVLNPSAVTGPSNAMMFTVYSPISAACVSIAAVQGSAITPATMIANGGAGGPYTFAASGLPAALSMSLSGTISGTPTVSGTFSYSVTIRDAAGNARSANCSITVGGIPDPGSTSSLLLVSGNINGTSLVPGNATVLVAPGAAITGSFVVSINSSWPSNDVMAMGVTPNWGPPSSSFTDLGGFATPVSGLQRTITLNLTAPPFPGTYYVVAAFRAEFTAGQVMSATNWQVGSLNWNTGYAIADWPVSTMHSADTAGTVLADYLFPAGNTPMFVPATAIKIVVGTGVRPTGVGIYRSSNGLFLLNSTFSNMFSAADTVTYFAGSGLTPQAADIPVVGDWSGNGTTKIGLYRPSTGTWYLDYNGNGVFDGPIFDKEYQYGGVPGDIPVVGDWNGSGFSKVGLFRAGFFWVLDTNGDGIFDPGDQAFAYGGATGCTVPLPSFYAAEPAGSCDIPVVGDWDSSGTTKVGIMRAYPGTSQPFLWILDTEGAQQIILPGQGVPNPSTIFAFGGIPGDVPIAGDFTGTGGVQVGVFRDGFFWVEDITAKLPAIPQPLDILIAFPYGGISGDIPIVGQWAYTVP